MTSSPSSRPRAFLIATEKTAEAERVYDALAPVLERLGSLRRIAHPASSLAYAAVQAEAAGQTAIQVAIGSLGACYLTPAVPTVLVPLWDYPHIPAADICSDGYTNWASIASRADLILAPSQFTADAFARASVRSPIASIVTPAAADWLDMPTWGENMPVTLTVPHVIWDGENETLKLSKLKDDTPPQRKPVSAARRRLRGLKPYFSNATIEKMDRHRQNLSPLLRPSPARLAKGCYRRLVRPWLSDGVRVRLKAFAHRLQGRPNPHAHHHQPACLAPSRLTLSGLVYATVVNYDEPTTDDRSLATSFIHAFADRADCMLVIRLDTQPAREAIDLARLKATCRLPGIDHLCQVVVIVGPLEDEDRLAIGRATSYFVDASRTRGMSLELSEAFASGRPMIAPMHSIFAEWLDPSVGFPVASTTEPTAWPIDPEQKHTTTWDRVVWTDLQAKFIESAAVAKGNPRHYEELSAGARGVYRERASIEDLAKRLAIRLDGLNARQPGAFTWVA